MPLSVAAMATTPARLRVTGLAQHLIDIPKRRAQGRIGSGGGPARQR